MGNNSVTSSLQSKPLRISKRGRVNEGAPRIWTSETVGVVGQELLAWFKASKKNLFIVSFAVTKGILKSQFSDWAKEFPKEFGEPYAQALQIQESRLAEKPIENFKTTNHVAFCLKNLAGWKDKHEVDYGMSQDLLGELRTIYGLNPKQIEGDKK